ncbi:MAG: MtnX-like HAD-IB family phosphatase [Candidatus Omnitrophica bacterium]|nr:MtnX-like HAD-IB family phosphatase [Candidatus Omnitrophota bacterium]
MNIVNRIHHIAPVINSASPLVLANCRVFIDFDNTITTSDVLDDLIKRFSINNQWEQLEKAWRDGKIGTKECLDGQLRNVRVNKNTLHNFLRKVELDPYFHKLLALLVKEGIKPVILSDNFTYIIEKILQYQGIKDLKVYGNSLRFWREHLIPSFPYDNPFCLTCAHCKKIHLTKDRTENKLIVFIGDGRSDFCPARVSDIVFAKDSLLRFMINEELPYIAYKNLGHIHDYFEGALTHNHKQHKETILK